MADVSALRQRVATWAADVQRGAVDQLVRELASRQPRGERGLLASDVTRTDTNIPGRVSTTLRQGQGGADRPEALPEWLDEGRSFPIRARRAKALRFTVDGIVLFRRQVMWNSNRRSQGFWSDSVNRDAWERALDDAARGRPLPP